MYLLFIYVCLIYALSNDQILDLNGVAWNVWGYKWGIERGIGGGIEGGIEGSIVGGMEGGIVRGMKGVKSRA